jgi:hypothetical protein
MSDASMPEPESTTPDPARDPFEEEVVDPEVEDPGEDETAGDDDAGDV